MPSRHLLLAISALALLSGPAASTPAGAQPTFTPIETPTVFQTFTPIRSFTPIQTFTPIRTFTPFPTSTVPGIRTPTIVIPATRTATRTPSRTGSPVSGTATATMRRSPTRTHTAIPTEPPMVCVGDCSGNGHIAINELVTAVRIALGETAIVICPAIDANGDGFATIDELVRAVDLAGSSCGGG